MPERLLKQPWRYIAFFVGIYALLTACVISLAWEGKRAEEHFQQADDARQRADEHIMAAVDLGTRNNQQLNSQAEIIKRWLVLNDKQNRQMQQMERDAAKERRVGRRQIIRRQAMILRLLREIKRR